ncbi:MAG: hypothetical protein KatS3mg102_0133 [Planctomycetota bacterium]|nr:MAG: hypothetical protein KatS3mg102_0133 [Planctomycetota bacterium]
MPDITLLMKPLAAQGEPGLDTLDERFQTIVGLVQNAEFAPAAERTEAVVREGIYDVRLLGYFLYGVFLERGVAALGEILDCLVRTLTENWNAFGPARKKERHADNALLWFMNRLYSQLEHEQQRSSETYQGWIQQLQSEQLEALQDKVEALRKTILQVLPESKVLELLPKLRTWLTQFHKIVYAEQQEAAAEQAAAEQVAAETEAPAAGRAGPGPAPGLAAAAASAAPARGDGGAPLPMVQGSHLLQELLRKLEAFERLVAKEAYERAAVVAADINELVEHFDPRRYLPGLFASYYRLLSERIREIEPHLENRDSLAWQSMSQHYQVDLESFVEHD